ncbi:hypothetical protein N3K66_005991 [Trichothecium roseum]|uniref:Uncharacterized protein n=1 Tax=Trichothecium roseum TaxID=47278 RepID=A0ACC0V067_9HYPO|nr:hypothetical protein N3K66_005991 [Trichothecium roseum]
MGCCVSRSSGDPNSPYPGGATIGTSSSHPINQETSNRPDSASQQRPPSSPTDQHRRRREQRPLDQHITKPLRQHKWTSKDRIWTRRQLKGERTDFFDTRVTGRSEIWQTIHAALQVLWDAESKGTQADDLATAETILSAAEISLPTGNLANGVYDSLGNYYPLPEWVVCDPTNMAVEEHGFQGNGNGDSNGNGSSDGVMPRGSGTAADEGSDSDQVGEKGKAVVDVGEQTAVRVRLSENGRDYRILVHNTDTVGTVTRQVVEVTKLASNKRKHKGGSLGIS